MQWPFKRKKTDTLPTDVQDYYNADRRERPGVAWALALGTLVITVVAALGLFFGGRWAYRKLAGTDSTPTVVTPADQNGQSPSTESTPVVTEAPSSATSSTNTGSTPPTPTPTGQGAQTAGTSSSPSSIPRTGADD